MEKAEGRCRHQSFIGGTIVEEIELVLELKVIIEEEDPRAKLLGLITLSGFWSSYKAGQVVELAEKE
jgi:hypothetical protein